MSEIEAINQRISPLQYFFIICSGADINIVKKHPTEWNKFTGIGATIFFTAVLACLSGGYAMHFAFKSIWVSVMFGLLWGIVIFNLDRYIVLSIKKADIPTKEQILQQPNQNEKKILELKRKRLKFSAFFMALPRIIIALIIAFTVSKPIELKLFEGRINKQLVNTQDVAAKEFDENEQASSNRLTNELARLNAQEQIDKERLFLNNPLYSDNKNLINKLSQDILQKETLIKENTNVIDQNRYLETRYKTTTNSETGDVIRMPYKIWVDNAIAKAKKEENKNLSNEIVNIKSELNISKSKLDEIESSLSTQAVDISTQYSAAKENIQQQLDELRNTYPYRKQVWNQSNAQSIDLPSRLEALGNISHFSLTPTNENFLGNSIWWASFVITLLFIALETAPVIVKLLTPRGIYDEVVDRIEYENMVQQKSIISQLNSEISERINEAEEIAQLNSNMQIQLHKDKLDAEVNNNKIILEKVAEYQQELALDAIEKWYKDEKAKIE